MLAGLLTEIGLPLTPEESIEAFMGRSWKTDPGVGARRGHRRHRGVPPRYLEAMFAAFEDELRPVPRRGALDAIALPSCVASSGSHEKIRFTLGHTGLLDRFDGRIFSATEVEHGKPAPDLFLRAAADGLGAGRRPRCRGLARRRRRRVAAGMTVFGYAGLTPGRGSAAPRVFTDMAELPGLLQPS